MAATPHVAAADPVANDDFADRVPLPLDQWQYTTGRHSQEENEPMCSRPVPDLGTSIWGPFIVNSLLETGTRWYTFDATEAGTLTVHRSVNEYQFIQIGAYINPDPDNAPALENLEHINCTDSPVSNRDEFSEEAELTIDVAPGTTYFIQVIADDDRIFGHASFHPTLPPLPTPSHDDIGDAARPILVPGNFGYLRAATDMETGGSTLQPGEPSVSQQRGSVWLRLETEEIGWLGANYWFGGHDQPVRELAMYLARPTIPALLGQEPTDEELMQSLYLLDRGAVTSDGFGGVEAGVFPDDPLPPGTYYIQVTSDPQPDFTATIRTLFIPWSPEDLL